MSAPIDFKAAKQRREEQERRCPVCGEGKPELHCEFCRLTKCPYAPPPGMVDFVRAPAPTEGA